MAALVQISGLPGTGKTFGAKTLDPKTTYIISSDKKGLSWTGWRKDYSKELKNYNNISDPASIMQTLDAIVKNRPDIKTVVIDTINGIMNDEQMLEMKKPNFDMWRDMAIDIYKIYDQIRMIGRDDLVVFVCAHIEPYDVNGVTHWRTKTNGKMLTKISLASVLNYNLYTQVEHMGEGNNRHWLLTQTDGRNEARSVQGVLDYKIPNDFEAIRKKIIESES